MKTTNVSNTNFSGLTLNAQRYIGDKIWSMASHGRAKEAVKTARLLESFHKEKNHVIDVIGYNGSPERAILVYKANDLAHYNQDAVNPINCTVLYKVFEERPKYVLTKLADIQKKLGEKIPPKRKFTSIERDFIDKFERSDNNNYNADGLYDALKNLEKYYRYEKKHNKQKFSKR